ncbi:NU6M oxidoreductase, partial [Myiagra hebetior]|nr:NU6M oxidoreductase [Myiagra hebetior]
MRKFVIFLGACFILGELENASNPSYFYGLVLASVAGCGWLMSPGTSFMSLVLFLVYLGRIYGFCLLCLWQWTPFQKLGGIC